MEPVRQEREVWMKKILFAASEAVPFIKTGGLADVVGSLPKCFDKEYFDVRVMIPKYLCIKEQWRSKMEYVDHFYMDFLGQSRYVGILKYVHEGITFYFIDNESYFNGGREGQGWDHCRCQPEVGRIEYQYSRCISNDHGRLFYHDDDVANATRG